jgi:hypothetical protein
MELANELAASLREFFPRGSWKFVNGADESPEPSIQRRVNP